MSLQDLGNIGEFVAAIAVVISLIYLAFQIRQNTKTVRTSTYQAVLDYSNRVNELILSNPHLERIWRVGRRDLTQLTDDERPQFRLLITTFLNVYETMFLQYRRGTLDEEYWKSRLPGLGVKFSQPGVRAHWLGVLERGAFLGRTPEFMELLDSLLDLPSDGHGSEA